MEIRKLRAARSKCTVNNAKDGSKMFVDIEKTQLRMN
jgi:hypothetical protein